MTKHHCSPWVELITAESSESRFVRHRRIIRFPQLTMPLLAAHIPPHWHVTHTDEIVQRVRFDRPYSLVGITANTAAAPHAYDIAAKFRARGIPVVIGGPHATLMPDEVASHADAVVVGEGELLWPKLLGDFEMGGLQKKYCSETSPDLRSMPPPRWDLIKGRTYGKGVTIATRGCPYRCTYCSIPLMYGSRMRFRPVGEVVEEIRHMPGRGLVFWDDNIGANRDYALELFRAMAPLKRWWTSQATLSVAFDDEFLRRAAESGCKALFIGLESVSQESLDGVRKRHNSVAEYGNAVRRLHQHGIALQAGTVFGFDGDDRTVFRRTVEMFRSCAFDSATIGILVPYPGTPLFRQLDSQGRILTRDWSQYDGKKHVVFQPALMSPQELLMGTEWAARQFYSLSSIRERMWRSRTGLWWNVLRNLGYHLALRNFGHVGYDPSAHAHVSDDNSIVPSRQIRSALPSV
jgi:radical SAM superfamily enzyme YgiQ (UPF0313 family)